MRAIKLYTIVSLFFLILGTTFGQVPVWTVPYPTVGNINGGNGDLNVNLTNLPGTVTVYYTVYSILAGDTPAGVKARSSLPPSGAFRGGGSFTYTIGDAGNTITHLFENLLPSKPNNTILVTVEYAPNTFLPTKSVVFATPACPPTPYWLSGLSEPEVCVNKGATAFYDIAVSANPDISGIITKTQWTINWGDGTITTYISASNGDFPSDALRTHTYVKGSNCNYIFSCTVTNPCGLTKVDQKIALAHGRDVAADGDGYLKLVYNATGIDTIEVCEGAATAVTIQDNSRWDCQNPSLPLGFTPIPNSDTRNIEWVYGKNPATGLNDFSISGGGIVNIFGLGNAPQQSGRIVPTPYGSSSLSQVITIPATCRSGDYFRVYLKVWNKCNPGNAEYVSKYITIHVIAAPAAPVAPAKSTCFGSDRTLTVTSAPVGWIEWYSDAALTTRVAYDVTSYVPPETAVGTYYKWITDRSKTGLGCRSASSKDTLRIDPIPATPTNSGVTDKGSTTLVLCSNPPISYIRLTASAVAGATYQWYKGGIAVPGAVNQTLTLYYGGETGSYTVTSVGPAPARCPSVPSAAKDVTIYAVSDLGNPRDTTVCEGMTSYFVSGSTDASIQRWQWQYWTGTKWSNVSNGGPYNNFNTDSLQIVNTPYSLNGTIYRLYIDTHHAQADCQFFTTTAILTVKKLPSVSAGAATPPVCQGSTTIALGGSYLGDATGAVWTDGGAGGSFLNNGGLTPGTARYIASPASPATVTLTLTTTGGNCGTKSASKTLTVNLAPAPITGLSALCVGSSITLADATPGGTWLSSAPAFATVNSSGVVSGVSPGVATIRYILPNGCSATRDVTVNPLPAAITGTMTVCKGLTTNLADATPFGTWASSNPAVATVTAFGAVTGVTPGTSVISYTLATGCARTTTVTVNPTPVPTITGLTAVCPASTNTYTTEAGMSNYLWTVTGHSSLTGGGTSSNTVTPTWPGAPGTGTVSVNYTNSYGCTAAAATVVNIAIGAPPTSAILSGSGVCLGSPSFLKIDITGGAPPFKYKITEPPFNGVEQTGYFSGTPIPLGILGVGPHTYNLTLITDNCGTIYNVPSTTTFTVNTLPVVTFGGVLADQCPESTTYALAGGAPAGGTYSGPGVTGTNFDASSVAPGSTYTITYTYADPVTLCPNIATNNINVLAKAPVLFPGPLTTQCINSTTYALTTGTPAGGTYSGPGVTGVNNFNAVLTGIGTFTITYTYMNGSCSNTATHDITVINIPAVAFLGTFPDQCPNAPAYPLTGGLPVGGTYSGPGVTGTDFNPGSVAPNNTYTLTYSYTDPVTGCTNTATNTIRVKPFTAVTFGGALTPLCVSSRNYTLTGGLPAGGFYSGNGVFGTNFDAQIAGAGTHTITYTYTDGVGCIYTPTNTILVNPLPVVTMGSNSPVCESGTLNLTGTAGMTTWSWAGPGAYTSALQNPSLSPVTAAMAGDYDLIITDGNGCRNTDTLTVAVNPTPVVTSMAATICSGGTFTLVPVDGVNGKVPAGTTYSWSAPAGAGFTGGTTGSGSANITGSLINTTITAQTATYTVTPLTGTCTGTTFTVTVTINPAAYITNPMTATSCTGSSFTVTPVNITNGIVPPGTTYSWTAPVVTGGMTGGAASGGSLASITGTLTNATNAIQTATYTVTPVSGGCTGSDFTLIISVNPKPVISAMTATICSGGTFTLTPADGIDGLVPAGTTYNWTSPSGSGFTGGVSGTGASDITGTLTNTTIAIQTATYSVIPDKNSCAGAAFTVTVTIRPAPAVTAMVTTICSEGSFSLTPVNGTNGLVPVGTTYSWVAPVVTGGMTGGAASIGSPTSLTGTITNTTTVSQTATYTITPTSPAALGSCVGAPFTLTVTVNPKPAINPMTASDCSGGTFVVTPVNVTNGVVPAGTTYSWSAPAVTGSMTGGAAGSGASNIGGTLNNITNTAQTATYTVTPTSSVALGSCTGNTFTVTVTVYPRPSINVMSAIVCSGGTFNVTPADVANGVVPAGTTYNWAAPTVTGGITGGAASIGTPASISGTLSNPTNLPQIAFYTVTPTTSGALGNCAGTPFTLTITVNPKPAISAMTAMICSGGNFAVAPADGTNGVVPAGTTYGWAAPIVTGGMAGGAASSGTPSSISGTLNNTTNTSQSATYTVTPTASAALGGCVGPAFTVTVTVYPKPAIAAMATSICTGGSFTLTPLDGVNGTIPAGTTYSWSTPAVTGGMTGGASGSGASDITGTLTNTSSSAQTATYTVTPVTPAGLGSCTGTSFIITVTVNPKPAIMAITSSVCTGTAFSVTPADGTNGVVPAGTTYTWPAPVVTGSMTGGAASVGSPTSITGTLTNTTSSPQTATYTVTPASSGALGGCPGASFTLTVTVNPRPAINPLTAAVCSGGSFTVTPVDVTNGKVPAGTTYSWGTPAVTGGVTGGAASIGSPANITGTLTNPTSSAQSATYTVTPTFGSCPGPDFTVIVTVNPRPAVNALTATVCSGGSFTITPADIANGVIPVGTTYTWSAPAVSGGITGGAASIGTLSNISGTLTNPTSIQQSATYTVTPTSSAALGSCVGAPFTVTVTVNPVPAVTPMTTTICSGGTFTVTPANGTNGAVPAGTTYSWASPTVTAGITGGAASVGTPSNISGTLTNSTNTSQTATYTVTPVSSAALGNCPGATFTVTVTVSPKPVINPMTATICSGGNFSVTPVDVTNGVVPAGTTYSWSAPTVTGSMTGGASGSGAALIIGTLTNTTSVVQTATYSVTPTTSVALGSCSGTPFTVTVTVNPKPSITAFSASVCSDGTFSITPADGANGIVPAGTIYTWSAPTVTGGITGGAASVGSPTSIGGTLSNPTSLPQIAFYSVTPTTSAALGSCTGNSFTVTVTVNPKPAIGAITAAVCSGGSFTVVPADGTNGVVPSGTTYSWAAPVVTGGMSGGAASSGTPSSISGTLNNTTNISQSATYTVTPTAPAALGGCVGPSFTVIVTVYPKPLIAAMTATVCTGAAFTVTPADGVNGVVPAGTTYTWAAPTVTGGMTGGASGSGALNITGTLTNASSSAQTAIYTVTPVTSAALGSCTGISFTVTVTVNPKPAITAMTATVCTGVAFTVTPADGTNGVVPAGTIYTWPAPVVTGSMTGGAASAGSPTSITGTLTNTTSSPQTATYTITPASPAALGGCTGTSFTLTVTVNPRPAITPMTAAVCSGVSFTITPFDVANGVVPAGTTYSWGAPAVTGGVTGGAASSGTPASITGTLTNSSSSAQTATYTVTPTFGSCTGTDFTVIVTVNPRPVVNPLTATICSGGSFTITPADVADGVVPAGTTYSWSAPAGSGFTGGASGTASLNITGTLTNTTTLAQSATYTVTPTSSAALGSCVGAPFTVTVTINPVPAVTPMTTIICSGGTFTMTPANGTNGEVPAGTTYSWIAPVVTGGITGGAASAGTPASISGTLTNNTNTSQTATYTVTPVSSAALGNCPGATFTVTVTVSPKPVINPMTATICSGGNFSVTPVDVTNGVVPAGTAYSWSAPAVTGSMTGGASGSGAALIIGTLTNPTSVVQTATYTVTPTNSVALGSCSGTPFTVTVTVNPKPSITAFSASVCSDGTFSITPADGANGIVPAGTIYTWSAPTVTGGITGGAASVGSPTSIGGTLSNPTNLPQIAFYSVTPTTSAALGSCPGNTFTVTVTVNPKPAIGAITAAVCSGGSFTVVPADGTNGVVPSGTTYSWAAPVVTGGMTGGAASVGTPSGISGTLNNTTNISHTATYTVTPTAPAALGGCVGPSFIVTVTVYPKPLIAAMTATICTGASFTLTPVDGVNGTIPAGTTYSWSAPAVTGGMTGGVSGSGALIITGTLTNASSSAQTAIYTVTPVTSAALGSCTGTSFTVTVTVNPKPAIAPMTAAICSGGTFTSAPADGVNGVVPAGTIYTWPAPVVTGSMTGGAASAGSPTSITGTLANTTSSPQTATYTITPASPAALGGCTGTSFTLTVTVNPRPAITLMTAAVCSGGSFTITPFDVANGVVPAGTTYSWGAPTVTAGVTGGASSSGTPASITGTLTNSSSSAQTATYTVTPTFGSCTGTDFTVTVTINPRPSVNALTSTICSGGTFTLTPTDVGDGVVPAGTIYTWTVPIVTGSITGGAASSGSPANISGTLTNSTSLVQTATYTVTPTSSAALGSCAGAPFTVTVTVNPVPAVTPMTATICSGGTFSLTPSNGTNGVIPSGTTYSWPAPVVSGGMTGGAASSGTPASISGTLTNNTNISQTATYTVTPVTSAALGNCPGATFTVTVTVYPKPAITPMTATICSGGNFSLTPADGVNGVVPAGTTYSWSAPAVTGGMTGGAAGGGASDIIGTLSNPTSVLQTATYTVTPITSAAFGNCTGSSFTVTVNVNPRPAVNVMASTICSGGTFTVTPSNGADGVVPAGTTYSWSAPTVTGGMTGGAASVGTPANITGTLVNSTSLPQIAFYTVIPTTSAALGSCPGASFNLTVTVNPVPSITPMTASACSEGAFTVTPADGTNGVIPAGTTYSWPAPIVTGGMTGGAASVGSPASITGTLLNNTNTAQTATYTVTPSSSASLGSCPATPFTVTVTINPKPAITPMTATVCSGSSFTVTPVDGANGVVPAGTTYAWSAPAVTGGMTGGTASSGSPAAISGTLTNTTNTSQTTTYTVTPITSAALGSCTGATFTVTVTVWPKPSISAMAATICSGGTFTVTPADVTNGVVPAGTTYSWSAPGVTGGMTGGAASAGSPISISGTLNNTTISIQTATYIVTPTSSAVLGNCPGTPFIVTISVNPKPAITPMTAIICSGGTFTVAPANGTDGVVPAGTTYSWPAPAITGGITGGAASSGTPSTIGGTLTNPTTTIQIAIYTVTPTFGTCTGADFTVTISVDPRPSIAPMSATICSGGIFTLTPADGINGLIPAGTTYTWSAPAVTGGMTGGIASIGTPASISGTLTNASNSAQTATYTVTPTAPVVSGGCTGASFIVTVTVNPKPAINAMATSVCSGSTFTLTPSDGTDGVVPAGTIYSWASPVVPGGMTGGLASSGNPTSISGTLTNNTNTAQTATYTVTPTTSALLGSCPGTSFTVTVTVNPKPAINPLTATICSGGTFTLTPSNGADGVVPAGTTYSWSAPAGSGFTGGATGSGASDISGTLINTTSTARTATYTVIPVSGGCTGSSFTVTVTVNPKPVINAMAATLCSGGSFTVTPADVTDGIVPAGTTYSWSAPTVTGGLTGGATGSGAAGVTGTLTNPTNLQQLAFYTVTPLSGSCTGATFTVTVTVSPKPSVGPMTATICSGGTFAVSPANGTDGIIPAGTTYTWAAPAGVGFTGGTTGSGAANITGTLINTTNSVQTATYTVTPLSGGCTGSNFTVTVTINPKPAVTAMTATICSAGSFTATPVNVTDGVVPAGTTYTWAAPAGAGFSGGAAGSGSANITGTLTNTTSSVQTAIYTVTPQTGTCTGSTFTVTVTINPAPAINVLTATICSGGSFAKTPADGTDGIVPAGTTYSWLAPAGAGFTGGAAGTGVISITGTLVNTTNSVQTATYTVTPVSGGCTGPAFTITVTINPKPAINPMTATICSGVAFTVTPANGPDGTVPAGTTYSWSAPSGSGFTGGATGSGAANVSGTLTNTTNSVQTATYTVTPVSGSCTGSTFNVTVTINPAPAINVMTATICSGATFTVTPVNGTDGLVPAGTTYSWPSPAGAGFTGGSSGSGAANISGNLTNTTTAVQTATYTVTPLYGSCSGPAFTVTVTINPKPAVNPMTATICSGGTVTLTPANGVDGVVPAGTTYSWPAPTVTGSITGGAAGTGSSNISGTLVNPTNLPQVAFYTVTPVTGSCTGSTFQVTVTVNPTPSVTPMTATICSGGSFTVTPVNSTNAIIPAGTTYSWSAPAGAGFTGGAAGAGAATVSGTLTNSTNSVQTATYTVTPLSGSCTGATFTVTVTINPKPAIAALSATICSGGNFTVTPVNGTDGIVPAGTTYSWSAPAGAGFTGGTASSGAANITGTLINTTSTVKTATYTVTPVSGSCTGSDFTVAVTINPSPAITAMSATICSGGTFTASPANGTDGVVPAGTTYTWSAPAGTGFTGGIGGSGAANITGTLTNTTNTVKTATYTVTPVAGGCTGSPFTVTVTINPKPSITNMTATICSGGSFNLTPANVTDGIVPAGTTYTWAAPAGSGFTGGAASSGTPSSVSGTLVNTTSIAQTATYSVTPVSGSCTGPAFTLTVTINPMPAITDITTSICSGGTFNTSPANGADGVVPAATTYSWSTPAGTGFSGGTSGSGSGSISGTLTNLTSTVQTATYTVTPLSTGCTGTTFKVIVTINPKPSISAMTATICSGGTFTSLPTDGTNGTVPAGTVYSWPVPIVTAGLSGGVASGGSSANITGSLVNSTNLVRTATYTVTPVTGTCTGATFTVTVTVNPKPAITPMTATVCSGSGFTVTPVNNTNGIVPAGTTYSWSAPAGTGFTGGAPGSGASSINGMLTNSTSSVRIATYTVTPVSGTCTGAAFTVDVTINPTPSLTSMIYSECSGDAFVVTPANGINGIVPAGTTYTWAAPSGIGFTGGAPGSSSANISGTITNTTNATVPVTYIVTPASGSCTGLPFPVTIMLNPKPAINNIFAAVCSGSGFSVTPVNVTDGIVPAGTMYSWTVPSGTGFTGGATGSGSSSIGGTLINTTNTAQTAIYTVIPISGICTGASFTITLTISPKPAIKDLTATICSGGSFTLTPVNVNDGNVPAGTTYSWSAPSGPGFSGGTSGSGLSSITGTLTNSTSAVQTAVYTVTPLSGSCTGTDFAVVVTVKPLPLITASPVNKIACEYTTATFTASASGLNPVYRWYVDKNDGAGFSAIADGDGTYFGAASTTLTISGATRAMNGYKYHMTATDCSVTVTTGDAVLTVNNVAEIVLQPRDSTICMNGNVAFQSLGSGTGIAYKWQVNKGSDFIDITDDANFSGSGLSTLTIINAPASFNNYIFRVVVTGTCGVPVYSNFAQLRLNIPPSVTFNPADKTICEGGGPLLFSSNGSGIMDSVRWQVYSGSVWSDIYNNGVYTGTSTQQLILNSIPLIYSGYKYRLAYKAKCTTVYSAGATLTVNGNPVVNFNAIDPINACGDVPLTLNGNPTGGSGTWAYHLWTGDVGPLDSYTIQSPTFTTKVINTYLLNYKVTDSNGCTGSDDLTVTIDAPDASYTKDKNNGCTPVTVTFARNMTGISKFWWDFGDGSPKDSVNTNPVHIFTNINPASVEYRTVKLKVRSAMGCTAEDSSTVTVYPSIDATFSAKSNIVCSGSNIVFTAATPGADKYFWDFGDGATGNSTTESTNHTFTNFTTSAVIYTVRLTTTSFYNCVDTKTLNLTVMTVPLPAFSGNPVAQVYSTAGNPVTFTNETNAGTWTWLWKFGDNGTSVQKDPVHTYTNLGEYKVTLIVTNTYCTDSVNHLFDVLPVPPLADFDSVMSGCAPLSISLNNTSASIDLPGTTYSWSFGDGSTSTAKNPTYIYQDAGSFRIELTVTGPGGTSTKSRVVNSYASPKASLSATPMKVFANDTPVRFFNLSSGADYYLWEFGDGDTSHVVEPYHKYMEEGVFDIKLWAYSINGCSDSYLLSPGVVVEPAGELRFPTVFTPNKDGEINMDHLPTGGIEYDQFFFPPVREKVMNYKLQIFNRWGTLIFENHNINIPWNGYYKGKLCQQGVYVWYVQGKFANGKPFRKVGDVTLLH